MRPACTSPPYLCRRRPGLPAPAGTQLLVELGLGQAIEDEAQRPPRIDPVEQHLVVPPAAEHVEADHPVSGKGGSGGTGESPLLDERGWIHSARANDALAVEAARGALEPVADVGPGIERRVVPVEPDGDPARGRVLEVEELRRVVPGPTAVGGAEIGRASCRERVWMAVVVVG